MAKILFNQHVGLSGFNIGTDSITYPDNQNDEQQIQDSTQNSLVCSFVNDDMYHDSRLSAQYKSQALARDKYIIYRQNMNDGVKKYIATIGNVTSGFFDYNIDSNQGYKYTVETNPADKLDQENQSAVTLETEAFIKPNWTCWSICDIEKNIDASNESGVDIYNPSDEVFMLKNNINVGSISDNLNIIKYNTLGKYGKVIQNLQKYDSGNISCLLGDFDVVQNIKNTSHVIIKDNVSTITERDTFLLSLQDKDEYKHCYFTFPKIDDIYYSYQSNNPVEIYQQLSDSNAEESWNDSYSEYYESSGDGSYVKLQAQYNLITMEGEPTDWDDTYLQYYIKKGDKYIQNVDSKYHEEIQYYKYEIPEFINNYYYYLAVSPWNVVLSEYIYLNTTDKLKAWRECLSNGKLKLLKAPNGQSWVVKISEPNTLEINWNSKQYPSTISFNWQEVIDKDKITIIKW